MAFMLISGKFSIHLPCEIVCWSYGGNYITQKMQRNQWAKRTPILRFDRIHGPLQAIVGNKNNCVDCSYWSI
jgi:hypothetical protein